MHPSSAFVAVLSKVKDIVSYGKDCGDADELFAALHLSVPEGTGSVLIPRVALVKNDCCQ